MQILQRLAMLAEQSGENVSEPRLEFMARRLLTLNAPDVCTVLEGMLETQRRFPTVGEIKAAMGITDVSDEDKAREVAERIWGGIAKIGSIIGRGVLACDDSGKILIENGDVVIVPDPKWKRLAEHLGPIGLAVVNAQGGWSRICDTATDDNATTLKAQWREFAAVLIRKARAGTTDEAPDFAPLPEAARTALLTIGEKMTVKP